MARGEPYAFDTRVVDRPKDVDEPRCAVQVAPVGIHVLTEQRDLFHARFDVALRFCNDILERT